MSGSVLVVGHADADGHLIAEQVRRNLELIESFSVDVVVDPKRTQGHRSWTNLEAIDEIDNADFVFFVDLMFSPKRFDVEAKALVEFVGSRPKKRFFLIDHHPLPLRLLATADNLRTIYRPDVFECVVGPRSGMMVVAALCEKQGARVADIRQSFHDTMAEGMRRAAAHGGELPGEKLLTLLRHNCWHGLVRLGNDDKDHHRLPRGRRRSGQYPSKELRALTETAQALIDDLESNPLNLVNRDLGETDMPYDIAEERFSYDTSQQVRRRNTAAPSKDLEAIVTLLEVAALSLTDVPDATFSLGELIEEAQDIAGDELELDKRDIEVVLEKSTFVRRTGTNLRLR